MKLKEEWIDEVLKLREYSPPKTNMNDVDKAFAALLQYNQGEARATIFAHATRLYFRAAATCPNVVARWAALNKNYGNGFAMTTRIKLWLLSIFRIHANSRLFEYLKKFYLNRSI